VLIAALLQDGEYLPHPSDILGDLLLAKPDEDDQDIMSPPWNILRAADGYMELLLNFTKMVVMANTFNLYSDTKLLSYYMTPHLEAFLVVTYVNGYDSWKSEALDQESSSEEGSPPQGRRSGNKRSREEESPTSTLTSSTPPSTKPTKKFTENARGRGKYKGWTDDGLSLYNKIIAILEQQRAKDSEYGEVYETNLRLEFEKQKNKSGGDTTTDEGRGGAGVMALNGLDLCLDDDVPPFGSTISL
jgi:hypothetical protein